MESLANPLKQANRVGTQGANKEEPSGTTSATMLGHIPQSVPSELVGKVPRAGGKPGWLSTGTDKSLFFRVKVVHSFDAVSQVAATRGQ